MVVALETALKLLAHLFIVYNLPCNQQQYNIKEEDLNVKHNVLGTLYRFYAYTKLKEKHFTAVLITYNKLYMFDVHYGGRLSPYKNNIGSISSIFLVRDDIMF